jgi:hypothetical protein
VYATDLRHTADVRSWTVVGKKLRELQPGARRWMLGFWLDGYSRYLAIMIERQQLMWMRARNGCPFGTYVYC